MPDFRKPKDKSLLELLTLFAVSMGLEWLLMMLRAHVALELYNWHVMTKWEALPQLEYWFAFWAIYAVRALSSISYSHKKDPDDMLSWPTIIGTQVGCALAVLLMWFGGWLFV